MENHGDIVFVDPSNDHFFWIVELEEHVHNMRDGRCLKNEIGPRCNTQAHKTLLDRALDWVAKRL